MGKYDDAILRRVQQAVDIVDLIGERVSLKKAGKDFKGLCPFHADRNPSMHVSPAKQIFKCFACGAGGDVFKFIQLADRVEFPEAVRILAGRVGIDLPERGPGGAAQAGPGKTELAAANKWAARKFRDWLNEPVGQEARKYCVARGFNEATVRKFGLGFAPAAWDSLVAAAKSERQDVALLAAAGLATARRTGPAGGYYDTLRNRLIFPILDASDRVIGFGGRAFGDETPKYLNTAESVLFNKGRELYGLRWARQAVARSDTLVIVEGYTDVIMAHQAGFENVVATLGTALTDQHVRAVARLAKRIVLIYDADAAGVKAADRALELFLMAGVDLAVGMMPAGLDPCDAIVRHGPQAFADGIAQSIDALEFKWRAVCQQFTSADGTADRRAAIEAMLATLAGMAGYETLDPIRRGLMLDRLASLTRSSAEELNRLLVSLARRRQASRLAPAGADKSAAPDSAGQEAGGPGGPAGPPRAVDAALAQILGVLLVEPSYYDSIRQSIAAADFADPPMRRLAETVLSLAAQGELTLTAVLRRLESPGLSALATELAERAERMGPVGRTFETAVGAVEHQRQLDKARLGTERILSGQHTAADWEALAKRPRDLRRGGGG